MTEKQKAKVKELRAKWQEAKNLLTEGKIAEIQAIIATHGLNVSTTGYMMCLVQMQALGLDGIPYLDCKTYKGWKDNGFHVKRGEHSQIDGITWVAVTKKTDKEKEEAFMMPHGYKLFHRSQVK